MPDKKSRQHRQQCLAVGTADCGMSKRVGLNIILLPAMMFAIYFSKKRAKLAKTEAKLKKMLVEKDGKTVRYLGDKFKFVKP